MATILAGRSGFKIPLLCCEFEASLSYVKLFKGGRVRVKCAAWNDMDTILDSTVPQFVVGPGCTLRVMSLGSTGLGCRSGLVSRSVPQSPCCHRHENSALCLQNVGE